MWLNVNLGKVNLETCWPAVYSVGCPTCPQGLLVTHVLTGPDLLHSQIVTDQSQASWPLCSPSPCPSVRMFLASLHWFSSVMGAVVLSGRRVTKDTASVGHYCIWWPFHHHAPTPRLISQWVLDWSKIQPSQNHAVGGSLTRLLEIFDRLLSAFKAFSCIRQSLSLLLITNNTLQKTFWEGWNKINCLFSFYHIVTKHLRLGEVKRAGTGWVLFAHLICTSRPLLVLLICQNEDRQLLERVVWQGFLQLTSSKVHVIISSSAVYNKHLDGSNNSISKGWIQTSTLQEQVSSYKLIRINNVGVIRSVKEEYVADATEMRFYCHAVTSTFSQQLLHKMMNPRSVYKLCYM